jgi:hypothetical protein
MVGIDRADYLQWGFFLDGLPESSAWGAEGHGLGLLLCFMLIGMDDLTAMAVPELRKIEGALVRHYESIS